MFSCEYCEIYRCFNCEYFEIFKNSFYRTPQVAVSHNVHFCVDFVHSFAVGACNAATLLGYSFRKRCVFYTSWG